MNRQELAAREFVTGEGLEKGGILGCISPFSSRTDGAKDPLSSRRRFIQRFLKKGFISDEKSYKIGVSKCGFLPAERYDIP